jgi:hypothetical protein
VSWTTIVNQRNGRAWSGSGLEIRQRYGVRCHYKEVVWDAGKRNQRCRELTLRKNGWLVGGGRQAVDGELSVSVGG